MHHHRRWREELLSQAYLVVVGKLYGKTQVKLAWFVNTVKLRHCASYTYANEAALLQRCFYIGLCTFSLQGLVDVKTAFAMQDSLNLWLRRADMLHWLSCK